MKLTYQQRKDNCFAQIEIERHKKAIKQGKSTAQNGKL